MELRGAGAQAAAVRLHRLLGVLGQAWRNSSEAKLIDGLTDSSTRELWRGAAGDSAPKPPGCSWGGSGSACWVGEEPWAPGLGGQG